MSFLNRNDFDELSAKFLHLLYERTEGDRNLINKTLDELNSMNYRYPMVKNSTVRSIYYLKLYAHHLFHYLESCSFDKHMLLFNTSRR